LSYGNHAWVFDICVKTIPLPPKGSAATGARRAVKMVRLVRKAVTQHNQANTVAQQNSLKAAAVKVILYFVDKIAVVRH
jgi:ribosomal protein L31E